MRGCAGGGAGGQWPQGKGLKDPSASPILFCDAIMDAMLLAAGRVAVDSIVIASNGGIPAPEALIFLSPSSLAKL